MNQGSNPAAGYYRSPGEPRGNGFEAAIPVSSLRKIRPYTHLTRLFASLHPSTSPFPKNDAEALITSRFHKQDCPRVSIADQRHFADYKAIGFSCSERVRASGETIMTRIDLWNNSKLPLVSIIYTHAVARFQHPLFSKCHKDLSHLLFLWDPPLPKP